MSPSCPPVQRCLRAVSSALMLFALLVTSMSLAPVPLAHAATIVRVKPGGTGNGSSWATAYTNLQDALAAASTGTEIWVAKGVYYPDVGTGQTDNVVTATFTLKDGVAIYGGFAGTETRLTERNWTTNLTVLSGDLQQNDTTNPTAIIGTNAYHVVYGTNVTQFTVLDGVSITAGNANGDSYYLNDRGGGMGNSNTSNPTLNNVTFSGNSASLCGGMYNDTSNPTLNNVIFSGNSAKWAGGGGMCNHYSSSSTLNNVIFSGNTAYNGAGGMSNNNSNPTLNNVTFNGNSTRTNGGGMGNSNNSNPTLNNVTFNGNSANAGGGMSNFNSSPTLNNVTFSGNSASDGGGMYSDTSNPILTNVTFHGNTASDSFGGGGGMYNGTSNPTLTNVAFRGNNTASNGGGILNRTSNPTLTNGTFSGNTASNGGGIFNHSSIPTLTNITFSGNTASNGSGGGIYNNYNSSSTIQNSILWGDAASVGADLFDAGAASTVNYSLVGGGHAGTGNLNTDPLFRAPIAATSAPTTTGDYRLQATSPAINAGDTTANTTHTDLDGNPRIIGSNVDMGAYEYGPVVRSIVRADPNPTNAVTVNFTVIFNMAVTGVDTSDFTLTKTSGQNLASTRDASVRSSATPTTTWTITITPPDLVTGTIRLDLVDDDSIVNTDTPPMPLGGSGVGNGNFSSGEVYTIDRSTPTVTLSTSASEPTNASTIPVTVTFSEEVTGFAQGDLTLGNALASPITPVSGSVYTFTLTPTTNGVVTMTVNIAAGVATDAAGNGNTVATQLSCTYNPAMARRFVYLPLVIR